MKSIATFLFLFSCLLSSLFYSSNSFATSQFMVSVSEIEAIFSSPLLKGVGGFIDSIQRKATSDGPVYVIITQEPVLKPEGGWTKVPCEIQIVVDSVEEKPGSVFYKLIVKSADFSKCPQTSYPRN